MKPAATRNYKQAFFYSLVTFLLLLAITQYVAYERYLIIQEREEIHIQNATHKTTAHNKINDAYLLSIFGFLLSLSAAAFVYDRSKLRIQLERTVEARTHQLGERVKELSTIFKLNQLLKNEAQSTEELFTKIVNMLPLGWQYPNICQAKISFGDREYVTPGYKNAPDKQTAFIKLQDGRTGSIEVVYLKEMPDEIEGPFLMEERNLINTVAETIEVYFNKKINKDALAYSEASFRGAFEHAAIGMALVSLQGKWLKINKELGHMLGYTEKELLNLGFPDITHPDDLGKDLQYLKDLLAGKTDFYRIEKRYFHKDGSVIWVNLNVALIKDTQSNPLYFVSQIENITARKNMELERQTIINDLVQRNKDLEQFSQIISHNVRAPLATIMGLSNFIQQDQSHEDRLFTIDGIENSAKQLDGVIRDLNEILHIKRDLSELRTTIKLEDIITQVKHILDATIKDKGVTIDYDFTVVPEINSVRPYIHSLFYNLTSNSIKYARHGLAPHIQISSFAKDGKTYLVFKDNGRGINMEKYGGQVFGLYKRFHPEIDGKGLGLYMVKTQVESLNGHIEISSAPGAGSTFTVSFEA
jgi:PAS domain S-box-containing protein